NETPLTLSGLLVCVVSRPLSSVNAAPTNPARYGSAETRPGAATRRLAAIASAGATPRPAIRAPFSMEAADRGAIGARGLTATSRQPARIIADSFPVRQGSTRPRRATAAAWHRGAARLGGGARRAGLAGGALALFLAVPVAYFGYRAAATQPG